MMHTKLLRLAVAGCGAALIAALTGCAIDIQTNPDGFNIEPGRATHLRIPQAVALKNGYDAEAKVSFSAGMGQTWSVEQKQLTNTAVAMLKRGLEKQGISTPGEAQKTIALRVRAEHAFLHSNPMSPISNSNATVTLDAVFGDGTTASVGAKNQSPLGPHRAFDGAVLFALQELLSDPRFVAYVNDQPALASAPRPAPAAPDFKAIAGKWQGTLYFRAGAFPATLTIGEDGRWENFIPNLSRPGPRFVGSLSVAGGGKFRYRSETTGLTGTWTVQEVNGERVLSSQTDDGTARGEYRPAAR